MATSRYRVVIERQSNGEWKWGLYAGNGHLMGGARSYNRKADARRAWRRVVRVMAGTVREEIRG